MAKPIIFVIGGTGTVGSASVRRLSEKHSADFELRVGVRDLDKAGHLKDLQGVTLVQAEMGSDDLTAVFRGVDALFIVTPPVEVAARVEKTAQCAKAAGVNFLVALSDATVALTGTSFGAESAKMEEKVRAVDINFCFLHLHAFYENLLHHANSVKSRSSFDGPCNGDQRFAQVAVVDIAKVVASIMTSWRDHVGKTYVLASQLASYNDAAAALTCTLKREIKYVRKPYDDIRTGWLKLGWPESFCDGLIEYYKEVDAACPVITTADLGIVQKLTGEAPQTLQQFVDSVSGSFVSEDS